MTIWPWPFDPLTLYKTWPNLPLVGQSVSWMASLIPFRSLRAVTAWSGVIPNNSFCKLCVDYFGMWFFQHESDPVWYCSIKVMISEPLGLKVLPWFQSFFLFQLGQHCLFCFVCIYLTFIISLWYWLLFNYCFNVSTH